MINVLVVDKNINYSVNLLNNVSNSNSNIRIMNITNSIGELYRIINTNNFDIILLDSKLLISTKLDLHTQNFIKKYKKFIIVLFEDLETMKKYQNFHCVLKDNFDELLNKILELSSSKPESQIIKNRIKLELEYLGYNPNHLGTHYIAEIIYIVYCTNFEGSLEKKIYPYIAKKHNKTVNTIKCNIINATTLMVCECPEEKLLNYLGKYSYYKPGPKTIIYTVINKI